MLRVITAALVALAFAGTACGKEAQATVPAPDILTEIHACLGLPTSSARRTARTIHTIALAIAAMDLMSSKQSPQFYSLADQLARQIDDGGFQRGVIWSRFLHRATVASYFAAPPPAMPGKRRSLVPFSLRDYYYVVSRMSRHLAIKDRGHARRLAADGRVIAALMSENLFLAVPMSGVGHYTKKQLLSGALAHYRRSNPFVRLVAHNRRLRHALRRYYARAIKMDYYGTEPLCRPFQSLIEDKGDLSEAALARVLRAFTKLRRLAVGDQVYNQWTLCHWMWQLLNLARARKDRVARAKIKRYVKRWRNAEKHPYMRRWLSEALEDAGPAPTFIWGPPVHIKLVKP